MLQGEPPCSLRTRPSRLSSIMRRRRTAARPGWLSRTVAGSLALGGGAIAGTAGAAISVTGGNATLTYSGSVTVSNAQRLVDISGTTGGGITLAGTLTGGASSAGVQLGLVNGNVTLGTLALGTSGARMTSQAVTVTGGSGTYSLGSVSIFTTGQKGIVATDADGTVNISSGRVDSANAAAIDIDGPAGLTTLGVSLTRVDSTGGSYGLRIQDANGSFAVTGDGGSSNNGSGGTISGMTGANMTLAGLELPGNGIYLRNSVGVSLGRMNITNNQNNGVFAQDVTGLSLARCTLDQNGNDALAPLLEGGVRFTRLAGTNAISDTVIRNSAGDNVYGDPATGTFTLGFTGGTIGPAAGGNGIHVVGSGTAQMTLNVTGTIFADHYVDGVQTTFSGAASQTVNVTGSTCLRNLRCVDLAGDGASSLRFDISGNTAIGQQWQPFTVGTATGATNTALISGFVRNNIVGNGAMDSGSVEMGADRVDQRGNPQGVVSVAQNTVRQHGRGGHSYPVAAGYREPGSTRRDAARQSGGRPRRQLGLSRTASSTVSGSMRGTRRTFVSTLPATQRSSVGGARALPSPASQHGRIPTGEILGKRH